MLIPRLRNVLFSKNSTIPSTSFATQFASFHSTPIPCDKRKNRPHFDVKGGQGKPPPKSHVRLAIRQRRADMKKSLEDFLYKSGCYKFPLQEEELRWKLDWQADNADNLHKKHRSKCSARYGQKSHQKRNKRKSRRNSFYEVFDDPETTFNPQYESFFRKSESEWTENLNWKYRSKTWGTRSDSKSDDESYTQGSSTNRTLLGLPPSGPLKIEDVKKAFHLSALKWHPDKHQGPSQAIAEEKFKLCVDAYKSLCNLLSTA